MSEKDAENKFVEEWRKKCPNMIRDVETCMRVAFAAGYDIGNTTGYVQGHDETIGRVHEGLELRVNPTSS